MNEKNTYSYSAQENKEIKRIRDKYTEPDERETKLEQLRRLDANVHNKAAALSLVFGIIGALLLGFGMSCVMVFDRFAVGISVGIVGIAIMITAYPIYKAKSERLRKEIAPLIIKISDELTK